MRKQWLLIASLLVLLNGPRSAWARLPDGQALQFVPHIVGLEAGMVEAGGLAIGDLDKDRDLDIVTAGTSGVLAYRHDGLGTFTSKAIATAAATRVRLTDYNIDGQPDLLVALVTLAATRYENQGALEFVRNDFGTESETQAAADDLARPITTVVVEHDLDDDGDTDVLSAGAGGAIYWLENDGQEHFTRHGPLTDLQRVGGVGVLDLDQDGDLDIVASDTVRGGLYWYEQTVAAVLPSPSPTPISVLNGNKPPMADSGQDLTVQPGALVVLDGRGSTDPERDALLYEWRQLAGAAVDILSDRTSRPSFTAGLANEVYIFMLTVKDSHGASAVDTVTVATLNRVPMLLAARSPLETGVADLAAWPGLSWPWLVWVSGGWLVLAVLLTLWLIGQRLRLPRLDSQMGVVRPAAGGEGRVVHYQTGQPIAGTQVFIYDRDNKLKATERTNEQGAWPTLFPAGEYNLKIVAAGFEMAAAAAAAVRPPGAGLLYTGGFFTIPKASGPLTIVIPVRPLVAEVGSIAQWLSQAAQKVTRLAQLLSWPVIGLGMVFSTALLFWQPSLEDLVIEALYVLVAAGRIAVGWRTRPAYGVVRDGMTKAGLDLAVVRLFTADTNRLVMTRVTNSQGRFFTLPPAGLYTVTVTKSGYSSFTKEKVIVGEGSDSTLPMTIDLVPLVPIV